MSKKLLHFYLIFFLIILILLEVYSRIFLLDLDKYNASNFYQWDGRMKSNVEFYKHTLDEDCFGKIKLKSSNKGFREPYLEPVYNKNIYFIGDSMVEASQVKDKEHFANLFAKKTGVYPEVIARNGISINDYVQYIKDFKLNNAEIYIFITLSNDIENLSIIKTQIENNKKPGKLEAILNIDLKNPFFFINQFFKKNLYDYSILYRVLFKEYQLRIGKKSHIPEKKTEYSDNQYLEKIELTRNIMNYYINDLAKYSKSNNLEISFIYLPELGDKVRDKIENKKIEFLDQLIDIHNFNTHSFKSYLLNIDYLFWNKPHFYCSNKTVDAHYNKNIHEILSDYLLNIIDL